MLGKHSSENVLPAMSKRRRWERAEGVSDHQISARRETELSYIDRCRADRHRRFEETALQARAVRRRQMIWQACDLSLRSRELETLVRDMREASMQQHVCAVVSCRSAIALREGTHRRRRY